MAPIEPHQAVASDQPNWDTGSHEDFYHYYEKKSLSPTTMERFRATTDTLLRLYGTPEAGRALDVLDIGCGAGAQAKFWLENHHHYWGVDINQPLIGLAQERARRDGLDARFEVATATDLPYSDASMDVCVLPELLEHVKDWEGCVNEAVRVLRPRGLIYISTSNKLCPLQEEFNLPFYSWYPSALKQYFERRALTDWPAVANFAKYPAVNWFTFFQLRDYLRARSFDSWDRFQLAQSEGKSALHRTALTLLRNVEPLCFLGHVLTSYTLLIARKSG